MTRPTWSSYFMSLAHAAATMGTCSRRKVGAIAVRDKRVLATGFNGSPAGTHHCEHERYLAPKRVALIDDPRSLWGGSIEKAMEAVAAIDAQMAELADPDLIIVNGRPSCSNAVHAEANVIAYAAASGVALRGATLYTNTYPCHGCAKQMVSCGIVEVVYDADYCNDPLVARLCEESKMVLRRHGGEPSGVELLERAFGMDRGIRWGETIDPKTGERTYGACDPPGPWRVITRDEYTLRRDKF